jgi:hypothetical protein
MTPIDQFNGRMLAEQRSFRLVQVSPQGPVAAPSDSYELRRLGAEGETAQMICYAIHDVPESVAVRIADAFLAGAAWVENEA